MSPDRIRPLVAGLVGRKLGPFQQRWTPREAILFSLAAGAGSDELANTFQGYGPRPLPTFALWAGGSWLGPLVESAFADLPFLYGSFEIDCLRELGPDGTVLNDCEVAGVEFKENLALVWVLAESSDDGETVLRGRHCFVIRVPEGPRETVGDCPPDIRAGVNGAGGDGEAVTLRVDERSHLIYNLLLPLLPFEAGPAAFHVDPEAARSKGLAGPILHGPALVGHLGLAIQKLLRKRDRPANVSGFGGRFRGQVQPGDDLTFRFSHRTEPDEVWLADVVNQRGQTVLDDIWLRP